MFQSIDKMQQPRFKYELSQEESKVNKSWIQKCGTFKRATVAQRYSSVIYGLEFRPMTSIWYLLDWYHLYPSIESII